jgi:hypothetical protein
METLYAVGAIASALAAVLAWAAKLWWGKEHAAAQSKLIDAKDAQIASLEREIETLRELTPMKIREYFVSVKTQLEEYNDALKGQLAEAHSEIAERSSEIESLQAEGDRHVEEITRLEAERSRLEATSRELTQRLARLESDANRYVVFFEHKHAPSSLNDVHNSWRSLRNLLSHRIDDDPDRLYDSLRKSLLLYFDDVWMPERKSRDAVPDKVKDIKGTASEPKKSEAPSSDSARNKDDGEAT